MPAAGGATPDQSRAHTGSFWRAVAYLTTVGWLMAVPIGASVLVGQFLDRQFGGGYTWTLALLGCGIAIAALEAFVAMRRALHRDGN